MRGPGDETCEWTAGVLPERYRFIVLLCVSVKMDTHVSPSLNRNANGSFRERAVLEQNEKKERGKPQNRATNVIVRCFPEMQPLHEAEQWRLSGVTASIGFVDRAVDPAQEYRREGGEKKGRTKKRRRRKF